MHQAASFGVGRRSDAGFTLAESTVAMGVSAVVLSAFVAFFVNSMVTVNHNQDKQAAIQVAGDAVERARALHGPSVLTGRGETATRAQWASDVPSAVRPYLDPLQPAWDTDPRLPADAGRTAPLPTSPLVVTVGGVPYAQRWYLGRRPDRPVVELVVAVTWADRLCPDRSCTYVTSTLFTDAEDPVFDLSSGA